METNPNKNNISGSKVLFIEHDDKKYYSFEKMLAHNGLKLLRVKSVKEAIHMSTKCFDIVFINIDIPLMDVLGTTKKIKVSQPGLPVIAHASLYSEEEKKKYLDAGCDRYMRKPLQKDSILNEISDCLRKRSKEPDYINEIVVN